ncbi:lipopolysaccharide biosynthesis protein [Pseudomonas putida]|uniref:Polysaccharide biosynthesis protein n=1 Tax=Pseudomonas putida TaxID=303 RepID=A0AAD0LCH4_PSEPU|nr:oligosaccharide flippase family protein [Pseudomonas putida]AXA26184.1 polysaccharide biosynthesis protein [Pseudomonas putida]
MSFRKNVIASYVGQIYVAVVGIAVLPLYMKTMGAEAYGLIGFFTMLQAWFALLDLGLTPTISRETARYRAGSMSAIEFRRLFRALSLIFLLIMLVGGGSLLLFAGAIASHWLKAESLDHGVVVGAVQIMAICIALRWMGGLYRGVITGSEKLVGLSVFNIVVATLRFVGVFVSLFYYGFSAEVFFAHQLAIAVLEFLGLWLMTSRLLPVLGAADPAIGWSFACVQPLLKFALSIAFTSSAWVLVTQSDKMILSGVLPLAEYGHFSLAVLVASGIMVLSGPVTNAVLPRLARLHAEGKQLEMIALYRNATRLIALFIGSVSIVLAFCARPLLQAWTGDEALAQSVAPILSLYAAGNGCLALAAFPYYLQYAKGDLRYHLIGNIAIVCVLVPAILAAALTYGGIGAGYAWFLINLVFFLGWVTYVHYKIEPGIQWQWLVQDCLKIIVPVSLVVWVTSAWLVFSDKRLVMVLQVLAIGVLALIVAGASAWPSLKGLLRKERA